MDEEDESLFLVDDIKKESETSIQSEDSIGKVGDEGGEGSEGGVGDGANPAEEDLPIEPEEKSL